MERLWQDLRFALRVFWKDRTFTLTTVLTLAVCIGANAATFTIVRSVLLRPLPYPESHRLLSLYESFPGAGVERAGTAVPNYFDVLSFTDVFDSVALFQFGGTAVGEGPAAEGVASINVTPSFFKVLRANAVRGRLFTEEEGTPGKNQVAILSYAFARRQPGGLDGIVGRQLHLDKTLYTVVGVLPEGFKFLNPEIKVWKPLAFTAEERGDDRRYSQNHEEIARLAAGVTLERAKARVDAFTARNIERAGPFKTALINAGYDTRVIFLDADLVRNVRSSIQMLWLGVACLLLIAAVNITNLSLARASGRLKEVATRHALGAGRRRVLRQLVTETSALTLFGGLLGLSLGYWSLGTLSWLGLTEIPRADEIQMDAVVVLFILALAVILGVVVGAVPAVRFAGLDLGVVLREDSRTGTAGRGARLTRRGLVASQVALAFVLLIGAGLLVASFRQIQRVDPGFRAEHVLTGRIALLRTTYPDDASLRSYTDRALERIRALPGVEAAGATSFMPFSYDSSSSVIIPEGHVMAPGESVVSPNQVYVTPGYLEALRVSVKRGRLFNDRDTDKAPGVVIIDDRLAAKFWPNTDPVGRRMYMPSAPEDVAKPGPNVRWVQVVGIIRAVKLKGLVEGEQARVGAYYLPYAQNPDRNFGLAIRTTGEIDSIRAAVERTLKSIDPEPQLYDSLALSERVHRSLNPRRAPMLLLIAFGVVALLLASLGIYGVLAYQVSQRTREIGIRIALGGNARAILGLVLNEAVVLVLVGLGVGIAGAVAMRGVIASQLYGVGALDPVVMLTATVVLVVAALVAAVGPARRAARVDPVEALSQ
jgi:putative ABC transport system permease protein